MGINVMKKRNREKLLPKSESREAKLRAAILGRNSLELLESEGIRQAGRQASRQASRQVGMQAGS